MPPGKQFIGKWALQYTEDDGSSYWVVFTSTDASTGDEPAVPQPSADETLIVYATAAAGTGYTAVWQLQDNLQYVAKSDCKTDLGVGYCIYAACQADIASAASWSAQYTGPSGSYAATYSSTPRSGILTQLLSNAFGYYTSGNIYVPAALCPAVIVTLSLPLIQQGGGCPGGDLSWVDLSQENLSNLDFTGASFDHAITAGSTWTGATLARATFREAALDGTSLATLDCTGVVFAGATLKKTDFSGATLSCDFTGCDLTEITYDSATVKASSPSQPLYLDNATVPYAFLALDWTGVQLVGATIPDLPSPPVLSSQAAPLVARGAVLTGVNGAALPGAVFQYADFTGATLGGLDLNGADFTGATLTGTILHGANLSNALLSGISAAGVQMGALGQAFTLDPSYQPDLLSGNAAGLAPGFAQNGIALTAQASVSTTGGMWELDDSASGALYTLLMSTPAGQAAAVTVYVPSALGATSFALPASYQASLLAGSVSGLAPAFAAQGITLSPQSALTLESAVWSLTDPTLDETWTIRLDPASSGTPALAVYGTAASANLTNAYLPAGSLMDANLYAVTAPGAQLYGESATLQGAILEEADLTGANLGSMSLDTARLTGAVLDGVVLIGATLNGAVLTPSTTGRATSLAGASLQGADFTDAQLYGASLTGAAVAVVIGADGDESGVHLFTADASLAATLTAAAVLTTLTDGTFDQFWALQTALQASDLATVQSYFAAQGIVLSNTAQITTQMQQDIWQAVDGGAVAYTLWVAMDANGENELYVKPAGAGAEFSLNPDGDPTALTTLEAALNAGDIATLQAAFQAQGQSLDSGSTIQAAKQGIVWPISDSPTSYTVWAGLSLVTAEQLIYARPTMNAVVTAFAGAEITLLPQATVSVITAGSAWAIDNDSENPQNLQLGYMNFALIEEVPGSLEVYGTSIHVSRLGPANRLEIDVDPCEATILPLSSLSADTVCPNGQRLSTNQQQGGTWNEWMRTSAPPAPPACVPNGLSYCNP